MKAKEAIKELQEINPEAEVSYSIYDLKEEDMGYKNDN